MSVFAVFISVYYTSISSLDSIPYFFDPILTVENNISEDKPEIEQKVTYAQIITGIRIGCADGS